MRWVVLVCIAACSTNNGRRDDGPPSSMPAPQQTTDSHPATVYVANAHGEAKVTVEVVATEAKIERGLMYREHLPPDAGMLFMMGREYDWAFYMRNTLIPLDMLFIAKDMSVAGVVENAEPRTETLRRVGKPSFYVLEVNAGWAAAHGVTAGAKVRFENVRP